VKIGGLLAALLLLTAVAASARAGEAIRPGRWEFTVELHMPGVAPMPPGVRLPPNMQMRSGRDGMTVIDTACVKTGDPSAALRRPPVPPGTDASQCKLDRLDRDGGNISWATTCTTAAATVHSEGTAHYRRDTMEARYTSRTTSAGAPAVEMSQHVTGRYLGPCTAP
jgi:Protein of unknown function (DUF3617)